MTMQRWEAIFRGVLKNYLGNYKRAPKMRSYRIIAIALVCIVGFLLAAEINAPLVFLGHFV